MSVDPQFKRAIEEVKLRTSLVEVVRERVPKLRRRGRLWEACCPFHEERTPSFKVDEAKGLWRCYGACGEGGDVLSFLQRAQGLSFQDALELLAARAGVELPRRRGGGPADDDPGLAALEAADRFFQRELGRGEGRAALDYLRSRGLSQNTLEAFGLGYAPRSGRRLVEFAAAEGPPQEAWVRAGLLRTSDGGELYSFFRGRLMIPIRDLKGRTVGFGARRLVDDDSSGPKYVNTPETPWFRKGRLIYALDRALRPVRRGGHLVLVEGYTDVMAAHQMGLDTVCAVLGTSTTEEHAALVRRAGARRVSLVFDGDTAGRRAAWRALEGLLPLDLELDVAVLPSGQDPADVLLGDGAEAFLALLEQARSWLDFVIEGLEGVRGRELAAGIDRVLGLLDRLERPVLREDCMRVLGERLDLPLETLRETWRHLPRRGEARSPSRGGAAAAPQGGSTRASTREGSKEPVDRRVLEAYKAAVGAALVDPSLIPRIRPLLASCPSPGLAAVVEVLLELFEDEDSEIGVDAVLTALGDHPVRSHVPALDDYARKADYPPLQLLDRSLEFLASYAHQAEKRRLQRRIGELQRAADAGDSQATRELDSTLAKLAELHRSGSPGKPPTSGIGAT